MEKHNHNFKDLVFIKVIADNPAYSGAPMGIIAFKCECGKKQPIEYGTRKDMLGLGRNYNERIKRRRHAVN